MLGGRDTIFGERTPEEWIAQYSTSHQNPVNRAFHAVGIPIIVISLLLMLAGIFSHPVLVLGVSLFILGWALQFAGHVFERRAPEFFHDWRFLLVGVRWWWAKFLGKSVASPHPATSPSEPDTRINLQEITSGKRAVLQVIEGGHSRPQGAPPKSSA